MLSLVLLNYHDGLGSLRFVASLASRLIHMLLAKPEIQKPKDLSNKRIGVVSTLSET
jgi:hypothetical protein